MSIPSDTQRPAGWYPDPDKHDRQDRWWGGSTWTSSIRPATRPQPGFPGTVGAYPMPGPGGWQQPGGGGYASDGVPTNASATAGLTLGILSLFAIPLTCVLGLIFSCLGLSKAKEHQRAGAGRVGRSKAIAGVVLSLLGILVAVVVTVALVFTPHYSASQVQDSVAEWVEDNGMHADSVSCPDDVSTKPGTTFECVVSFSDGTEEPVALEMGEDGEYTGKLK